MSWNQFVKDYLIFSKKERIALLVVLSVLLFVYLFPLFSSPKAESAAIVPNSILSNAIDTLQASTGKTNQNFYEDESLNGPHYEPAPMKGFTAGALFQFDPNTLPAQGWRRLGLNDRTIKTISNYRDKGGKFYKPEDLKKIWSMPEGFYERVANFITIQTVQKENNFQPGYTAHYEKKERKPVDINAGDTTAFIALPGIGSRLAFRIISFREKLGGFYSVDQVGETYGLPDSTFQKIKAFFQVDANSVKKININAATKEELKIHPYIKWNLANAIVEYRTQHGAYKNLDELKNIVLVDGPTFDKIVHYLSL